MRIKKVGAIAIKGFALLVVLGMAHRAMAQDATTPYPTMAPIEQYLALVASKAGPSGVVLSTYRPSGPLRTGTHDIAGA